MEVKGKVGIKNRRVCKVFWGRRCEFGVLWGFHGSSFGHPKLSIAINYIPIEYSKKIEIIILNSINILSSEDLNHSQILNTKTN